MTYPLAMSVLMIVAAAATSLLSGPGLLGIVVCVVASIVATHQGWWRFRSRDARLHRQ